MMGFVKSDICFVNENGNRLKFGYMVQIWHIRIKLIVRGVNVNDYLNSVENYPIWIA